MRFLIPVSMSWMASSLVAIMALWGQPVHAAPSGLLNDTGQTLCYDGTATLVACSTANTGDSSPYPRQDGRFGRDAKPGLAKAGAGPAGFDFTPLDTTGSPVSVGLHVCVKDNHTQLIWSTETIATITWTDAATQASTYGRCGYTGGWRLPTRRELLSIVHRGRVDPAIDPDYFPSTLMGSSDVYWSSDTYAPGVANSAWGVRFNLGSPLAGGKNVATNNHARFVRDAP